MLKDIIAKTGGETNIPEAPALSAYRRFNIVLT
jgi:hypothetical protein